MKWVKGQSGNPGGKVRSSVRQEIRRMAALQKGSTGPVRAVALATLIWDRALSGEDMDMARWVTEQVDGKLPTPVLAPAVGEGLRIEIVNGDS